MRNICLMSDKNDTVNNTSINGIDRQLYMLYIQMKIGIYTMTWIKIEVYVY